MGFETSVTFVESGERAPLQPPGAANSSGLRTRPKMNYEWHYSAPWGFRLLDKGWTRMRGKGLSLRANRMFVLLLTFLCYTAYHASRKPPSIVKSVLHGEVDQRGVSIEFGAFGAADNASSDAWAAHHWAASHHGADAFTDFAGVNSTLLPNGTLGSVPGAEPAGGSTGASLEDATNDDNSRPGWKPFNNPKRGKGLLGDLDLAFLGSYACGMFVAGHLGDRVDLRYFLTGGMIASGLCVALFGAAAFWNIHSLSYFLAVQLVGGFFQATGWPSVVSIMANWFGKGKRGLIMGVWNAHTSVGNIAGSLIAAYCLRWGWGWSFVVPGAFIAACGLVIFSFLVVEPQDIGFLPQSGSVIGSMEASEVGTPRSEASAMSGMSEDARAYLERHLARLAGRGGGLVPAHIAANMAEHHTIHGGHGKHGLWGIGSTLVLANERRDSIDGDSEADLLLPGGMSPGGMSPGGGSPGSELSGLMRGGSSRRKQRSKGLSFLAAWAIPGVAVFAMTLFFAKLVAYTFLYWLPYYIGTTDIGGRELTPSEAGQLSILFDVGGVLGGVMAGHLSDATGASALVSAVFVYTAVPFLYLYRAYGSVSFGFNIGLMMAAGFFVNGPYALITTAVSADLGTHESLAGNEKALATVTAIIDGMGSVGAAIGPAVVGYISELPGGFNNVFLMLYGAAGCAGLLLSGLVYKEIKELMEGRRHRKEAEARSDALAGWPGHPWDGSYGEAGVVGIDVGVPAPGSVSDARIGPDHVQQDSEAFAFLPPGLPGGIAAPSISIDTETGRVITPPPQSQLPPEEP